MDDFLRLHQSQFDALQIPAPLHESVREQVEAVFQSDDAEQRLATTMILLDSHVVDSQYGSILVVPHVCSWDINNHRGLLQELSKLSDDVLRLILAGLHKLFNSTSGVQDVSRNDMLEGICRPRTWSHVILYRRGGAVRAALPAPPYYPQVHFDSDHEFGTKEADLTGPFPFQYHRQQQHDMIDTSLVYVSPGATVSAARLPTLDLVPSYVVPDPLTRSLRYVALLLDHSPNVIPACCLQHMNDYYKRFQSQMQLGSLRKDVSEPANPPLVPASPESLDQVIKVFTDSDDPMGLKHPVAGLSDPHFQLVDSIAEADVVFSYHSLFAPTAVQRELQARQLHCGAPSNLLFINQYPFEGAFVQKDHLAREIWNQYGMQRPQWAIESYDLDVQLAPFIGAVVQSRNDCPDNPPVWIVKPARGTQSKGHLVTRSTAHILRLVDAGTSSRVVQRYIENPLCYQGRKIDCRCVVLMTNAQPGSPDLYMHKRVFLRIAHKTHSILKPSELMDPEAVLTATHLFQESERSSNEPLRLLPIDTKTISQLEEEHGFEWQSEVLPKIHTMIRQLFSGMTRAFPAMAESTQSRAVYGVDVMFEVARSLSDDFDDEEGRKQLMIQPKLTEVTFCPANNAICDAYERDEDLYRTYLNDVFNCLFRGVVSENLTKL